MKWLKGIFSKKSSESAAPANEDRFAYAEAMLEETDRVLDDLASLADELSQASPEEMVWMEWFLALPEEHKKIVEFFGEKGAPVTPINFDEALAAYTKGKTEGAI